MRTRADYGRIARCYDRNPRRRHDPDLFLGDRLARAGRPPFVVLDVGCGTGAYLTAQLAAHAKAPVQWLGLDLSSAMLAHAKQQAPRAQLVLGRAEQLPYLRDSVDYVVTTFAFHHFEDKHRALDEMRRVARRDAAFRLVTIVPEAMPDWWIYRFFPNARAVDARRFWPIEDLRRELELRGYTVDLQVRRSLRAVSLQDLLQGAERRDVSQLDLLDDIDYQHGLEQLRKAALEDSTATVESQSAVVECHALIGSR